MKRILGLPIVVAVLVVVVAAVWFLAPPPGGNTVFVVKKAVDKPAPSVSIQPVAWQEGKSLFKANCAACHNPKSDGTGPVLTGVTGRWKAAGDYKAKTGEQWLKVWIHNWKDAQASGYKYAVDMANSRPSDMNIFSTLKEEQIDQILLYVNNPDGVVKTAKVQ